jgi:formate dehydrogenase major subunit
MVGGTTGGAGRAEQADLHWTDFLDNFSADCERLKLLDGEKARLCSTHGEVLLPVRINAALKPGTLFATFHTAEVFLNNLTSPYRDKYTLTPEYKVSAVRVEKL